MRGNLLSKPGDLTGEEQELSKAVSEYRRKMEQELLGKIQVTLQPLLGESGFRATVSLDCDLTSGDQSEETFDPSRSVMLNSQKSEDGSTPQTAAGVPGTPANLPRPAVRSASGPGSPAFRRSENTTFQTSRMVRHIKLPQGQIRKLSASVLIDYMTRTEGNKKLVEPAAPERIRAIKDLVAAAVGFQQERGDQIIVESIPFEVTRNPDPPPTPAASTGSNLPRISLPASIPPWVRVPMEGHLNWLVQQNWLPGVVGGLALGILYAIYRLLRRIGSSALAITRKAGSFAASKLKRNKDKGQHVDVTLDTAIEPAETPARLESGEGESSAHKSIEQQLQEREQERERLTKEALLQLEIPKAEVRKGVVITRHLNELVEKDSENFANFIRTWVPELEK